jgi:glycosyltransferase involved in cell wall biosynthesis
MAESRPNTLIVEGWRFLAHSYAVVNQWQLLALLRRSDVTLKIRDTPNHNKEWQRQDGLYDARTEQALKSLEVAESGERADATLRISFPFDFSPSPSRQTAVFATSENQVIRKDQMLSLREYERLQFFPPPPDLKIVTPSLWSSEGFYRAGFARNQVLVVPHGADPSVFTPMPGQREQIRRELRISERECAFLSVGSMTENKGIDLLLKAFAQVCQNIPHAKLILKGLDPLYRSKDRVAEMLQALAPRDAQLIADRLVYFGRPFPHQQMARLYQAADVYVSPYRAEGFNLPVLEAAASGLPIICTGGGATDDFVTDAFAQKIQSQKVSVWLNGEEIFGLEPSLEHLSELMIMVANDSAWRNRAAGAAALHVRSKFTWDHAVDRLLRGLFG